SIFHFSLFVFHLSALFAFGYSDFDILYQAYSPLRKSGYSFSPTLRFATHGAELTPPAGLLQRSAISFQAFSQQSKQLNK
ncbi:hypothetical protein, partial [Tannerella forsythia]|uniref:hypothetical protein n=1 Tax=Tannerella forsythia TaxID=28112 RepID=UPI001C8AE4A7